MTSQSEHTNRQRTPQQAPGRKWPILVLLLGLAALTLALTACGGSSSTRAPDATTGSPPTATSPPASTPPPEPTEVAAVGEGAGTIRETREYAEALCAHQPATQEPATWGEAADRWQKGIDLIEKNEPPEELRDYFEALVAMNRLMVRFAEERRSLSYEDDEAWSEFQNDPEMSEAIRTSFNEQEALDDAVQEAFNEC